MSKAGNSKRPAGRTDDTAMAPGGRKPPALTVVAAQWADRPPEETLHTAALAGELGYPELWIGEAATYDAFALATAIGLATERIALTIGPLSMTTRDPAMIAMGAASVAALTHHPVTIAVTTPTADPAGGNADAAGTGPADANPTTSTDRAGADGGGDAAGAADADGGGPGAAGRLIAVLDGLLKGDADGPAGTTRLPATGGGVTVAALESAAVRVAAEYADRLVLDLVNVATAARVRGELDEAAAGLGRAAPRLTVRLPAAVDPAPEALAQLVRGLVPYLGRPGHREMFTEAGFGEVADLAHGGAAYQEVVRALPLEIVGTVGLIGTRAEIAERLAEYAASGVDDVALIPATARDRGGATTLTALHDLRP